MVRHLSMLFLVARYGGRWLGYARTRNTRQVTHLAEQSLSSPEVLPSNSLSSAESHHNPFFPIYYNDVYTVKLPPNHRFPMDKYRQVREMLQDYVNASDRGVVDCTLRVSPMATIGELTTTHCIKYVQRFMDGELTEDENRNIGFPWSASGVNRARSSTGGTVAAAVAVCEALQANKDRICWGAHVAGGTHHAFYDRGEGFCVFSDIAVAANVVLERYDTVQRVLVLDLDVHQGNGNAKLFQGRPEVFTFSMHCRANYFSEKQDSDLDIELPEDCNDATYLATLNYWMKRLTKEAGKFDLIFFQAGVDILTHDRLGRMNLSAEAVSKRNKMVYEFASTMGAPLVITMGGGYPRTNDWTPILDAHTNVYTQALDYLECLSHIQDSTSTSI